MKLLNKPLIVSIATAIFSVVVTTALSASPVLAQNAVLNGVDAAHGTGQPYSLFGDSGVISTVTNVLLFIAGALSVVMIIVGGLRYVVSGGNSSSVTAAKNTILYAIVGLIIAFMAFAVVNWILASLAPGGSNGFSNT